ncbi:hypothetical protein E2C01_074885 [Portunus trituberculatus]|uniref:Uncharacterized protein n=1 Tax=Portunus trituberculatus TaxID=210409 RepID=A0A5B7IHF2_PORTR|nr:hypothetical protein [Portunus trituberculatus]
MVKKHKLMQDRTHSIETYTISAFNDSWNEHCIGDKRNKRERRNQQTPLHSLPAFLIARSSESDLASGTR